MKPRRAVGKWLVAVGLVSVHGAAAREDKLPVFTRSIYLPVRFAACPNLADGTLYENREPAGLLPFKRIYQFTYYSDKDRFVPERYEVVVTVRDTVQPRILFARVTVSLEGVRVGERFVHRTSRREVERQWKRKRDARFEEAELLMHCTEVETCPDSCPTSGGENESRDIIDPGPERTEPADRSRKPGPSLRN